MWWKSWCECRSKVWLASGIAVLLGAAVLVLLRLPSSSIGPQALWDYYTLLLGGVEAPIIALILAGSGINSQSSWGMQRGFHPSAYFLLALPVSRRRALLVRAALGGIFSALFVVFSVGIVGLLTPLPAAKVLRSLPMLLASTFGFFGFSTFLTCWLDELLAGTAGLAAVGFIFGGETAIWGAVAKFQPIAPESLPWPLGAVFVASGIVFLIASVVAIEKKEY
jgi:hypothetical protein